MKDDVQAIRDVISTWMHATATGDLAKLSSLVSDDVIFLLPGQERMRGREKFLAEFRKTLGQVRIVGQSDIQEIQVAGDWAWCWNHLRVTISPLPGGRPTRRAGYTLSIFRKLPDGRWVLTRDANMLVPEPQ